MADANRKAPRLNEAKHSYINNLTIKDAEVLYAGEMVLLDTTTEEVDSDTSLSGKVVLGINDTAKIDNTADGETINFISTAIHGMDKIGAITVADIGKAAYVEDAASVSVSGDVSAQDLAGYVVDVNDEYVYVDFDPTLKQR